MTKTVIGICTLLISILAARAVECWAPLPPADIVDRNSTVLRARISRATWLFRCEEPRGLRHCSDTERPTHRLLEVELQPLETLQGEAPSPFIAIPRVVPIDLEPCPLVDIERDQEVILIMNRHSERGVRFDAVVSTEYHGFVEWMESQAHS